MIKCFTAFLAASSVKMNTVQCIPVKYIPGKYNTSVVYNKDSRINKGSYLQMGLIKCLKP